jgi:hypothetical protein
MAQENDPPKDRAYAAETSNIPEHYSRATCGAATEQLPSKNNLPSRLPQQLPRNIPLILAFFLTAAEGRGLLWR